MREDSGELFLIFTFRENVQLPNKLETFRVQFFWGGGRDVERFVGSYFWGGGTEMLRDL